MSPTSAYERDIRDRLDTLDPSRNDAIRIPVPAGMLRGVLHDLDLYKRLATNNVVLGQNPAGFDDLLAIAKLILDEVYPDDIFPMPAQVIGLLPFFRGNEGPLFVAVLRKVIAQIEQRRE